MLGLQRRTLSNRLLLYVCTSQKVNGWLAVWVVTVTRACTYLPSRPAGTAPDSHARRLSGAGLFRCHLLFVLRRAFILELLNIFRPRVLDESQDRDHFLIGEHPAE